MDTLLGAFRDAQLSFNGYQLADTLTPTVSAQDPHRLRSFYRSTNVANVYSDIRYGILYDSSSPLKFSPDDGKAWIDLYVAFWKAVGEVLRIEEAENPISSSLWNGLYEAWKEVANVLIRGYSGGSFEAWTVPCFYVVGKYLRIFAIKADEANSRNGSSRETEVQAFQDEFNPEAGKNEKLEDAARVFNRMFTICVSDRAPIEESRKWAIYSIVNLLFKTYFKLNSISLSKNILKALQASKGDMPELSMFPKSHQVTFKYYVGVIQFLEEDYKQAESNLTEAWELCHKKAIRNKELILTYLIPCHLLTTHTLPTQALLKPYPRLQNLFLPLSRCIKLGDLAGFDGALVAGENEFVKRRIYLTLERGRDIALRNLLRKVFIAGGFEEAKEPGAALVRRTRVPVAEFSAAISLGSKERMENDEVECLLANIIYKNLMKGYIARERGIVVLQKKGEAFPGTGV